jgi:CRISPR-associated protein Cas1
MSMSCGPIGSGGAPAARGTATSPDLPDLIPARMLNAFVYCPRLFYLEFVQGQFVHSVDTLEGRMLHRRVDEETGTVPSPDEAGPGAPPVADEAAPLVARSVYLSAPGLGLTARIDLLEAEGAHVTPVDYKHGSAPEIPARAWDPERVQICAQALILRENGYQCDQGVIYYAGSRTRVAVPIDDELVNRTLAFRDQARQVAAEGRIPPPLVDSPKCPRCSLAGICLPDEIHSLGAERAGKATEVRRLLPARPDALPVYVLAPGGSVGKSGDQLYIAVPDAPRQTLRLLDVAQLNLFGNIQVSAQAMRELAARGIPICYFSFGGYFQAMTVGLTHKNVELRIRQFRAAEEPRTALQLARRFIMGKITNCRTLLRRNASERPHEALRDLLDLRRAAAVAPDAGSLLGIEGNAARIYFQNFSRMLKIPEGPDGLPFDFNSRNRRPPRDPVNALLSLGYALLVKDLTATLLGIGFDPFLGFYHRPRYGRPALALDLAEEFRPLIVDSVVLQVLNTGEIKANDFVVRGPACNLTTAGRRTFIEAYERRLDTLIRHPLFGYTISYRRVLDVQARILGAFLQQELRDYVPFVTR